MLLMVFGWLLGLIIGYFAIPDRNAVSGAVPTAGRMPFQ